ncbi:unnamed protein product, partial [Laminaria digitata]
RAVGPFIGLHLRLPPQSVSGWGGVRRSSAAVRSLRNSTVRATRTVLARVQPLPANADTRGRYIPHDVLASAPSCKRETSSMAGEQAQSRRTQTQPPSPPSRTS